MICVLSYSAKDYNLAFSAAGILLGKTDINPKRLWLYGSLYAPSPPQHLSEHIGRYIQPSKDEPGYPMGPNTMFAELMSRVKKEKIDEPLFLMESDGFVTCRDWYDRVLAAHSATGKLVSGAMVDWVEPEHLNGNMVCDPKVAYMDARLARCVVDAWDCHHAEFFLQIGADNAEIHNPRRKVAYYPTKWWLGQTKRGIKPAYVHGCQNFQVWEHIDEYGVDRDSEGDGVNSRGPIHKQMGKGDGEIGPRPVVVAEAPTSDP